ncbi:MAG: FHA domain-containing protein [Acidobacteria bacterium]|nr:FHA domain-containing protein [Acidobacteriota bacterium]
MSGSYPPSPNPAIRVRVGLPNAAPRDYYFTTTFRIGRVAECELCIEDPHVSRQHATVGFGNGQWWVQDLNSANGIWMDGQRVQTIAISQTVTFRLGVEGPWVMMQADTPSIQAKAAVQVPAQQPIGGETRMIASYTEKYLTGKTDTPAGERTMMIRKAFTRVQKKQKRKHWIVVGALVVLLAGVGGFAWYRDQQVRKQTAMAQELFYSMKSLDVDIANVERLVADSSGPQGVEQIRKFRERRTQMENQYDKFLSGLKLYDKQLSEEERLILRMARVFGECELAAPPEFITEVKSYIGKWQSSPRYKTAIERALSNGYHVRISKEFLDRGLPPQFFYLAMQESNFEPLISGPMTYKGYAKGMWQFIPETGEKYGLKTGPLFEMPRPDPGDDRHNWEKATVAASKYIKDIYSTDAQASGLLVMASYNWGEHRVIKLLQTMPANPKERNFWQVLTKYRDKWPNETYDYVYYIFSAAVIGENPRLFGFQFDNPLSHLEKR